MNVRKYLDSQYTNRYLPKEQLKRLMTVSGFTKDHVAEAMGVSVSTVSMLRSQSASATKNQFSILHSLRIARYHRSLMNQSSKFEADRKSRGFLIVYDDLTWGRRIGVAKDYETIESYDNDMNFYLAESCILLEEPERVHVVSLKEVANALDVDAHTVLESITLDDSDDSDDWDKITLK